MSKREDMRPPTNAEFLLGALSIQDDVAWFNWRDSAVRQGYSNFEQEYQGMCATLGFGTSGAVAGTSPVRVHNVAENNMWGYQAGDPDFIAGIPCTFGLTWSGWLFQAQVEALNKCTPLEMVLAYGAGAKDALRAVAEKAKP